MASVAAPAPVDPDVVIPRAVLQARENAERLMREAAEARANPDQPVTPEGNPPPANDPIPTQANEPPAQPDQPPPPAQDSWEHKYHSVNGRYATAEKRVNSLQQQLNELTETANAMRTHIAHLELQAKQPANDPKPAPRTSLITDEDRETYGDDLLDVVARRAEEVFAPKLTKLEQENEELRRQLGNVGEKFVMDAREKLYKTLDDQISDWRTTNSSEAFLEWLALSDPYTGVIRKNLMMQAFERNDAARVLAFFKGFHAEVAATAPAGSRTIEAAETAPKVPLATLAAPGRAKSEAAPAGSPTEKPTYTRAQIGQFYRDVSAGLFHGREAEKRATEADIIAAGREGRIR